MRWDKIAPKTTSELLGNPKAHESLMRYVKERTAVCLVGDPGSGKTTAAYVVARELGLNVMELNASDERTKESSLPEFVELCQQVPMTGEGLLFLLDEVDGMGSVDGKGAWEYVKDILKYSKHAVVLTCNDDYKIPATVKGLLVTVKLIKPNVKTVEKYAAKIAKENLRTTAPTTDELTSDFRNAINVALFGGEPYKEQNTYTLTHKFFVEGDVERIDDVPLPFLFDNAPNYLKGWDLFQFYRVLRISAISNQTGALSLSPRGSGTYARFPGYMRMRSSRKKGEDDVESTTTDENGQKS
jgi:hypothetical protein